MEVNKNTIYKNAANYGLILGLATIIYSLLMRFSGFLDSSFTFFGYQVIMAIGIAFSTKKYREEIKNNIISYSEALGFGLLISIFSGLIQAFFVYAYYVYVSPEDMDILIQTTQELLINMGKSDEEVEMAVKIISPTYFGFSILLKEFVKGLLFSLIIASFVKKEADIFDNN